MRHCILKWRCSLAAATEPLLMTVDQYRKLPERSDVVQELHWGQLVTLTYPKMRHTRLQYRLVELLRRIAGKRGIVASEIPFRLCALSGD